MPTRRLFFALRLDELAARAAHQAAQELADRHGGRVMRQDSLHLTLAFLGEVAEPRLPELIASADRCAANTASFTLLLDRLGVWPRKKIVWASCSACPPPLSALAKALLDSEEATRSTPNRAAFFPHVTLLRHCAVQAIADVPLAATTRVKEFHLIESLRSATGTHYRTLSSHALQSDLPAD